MDWQQCKAQIMERRPTALLLLFFFDTKFRQVPTCIHQTKAVSGVAHLDTALTARADGKLDRQAVLGKMECSMWVDPHAAMRNVSQIRV